MRTNLVNKIFILMIEQNFIDNAYSGRKVNTYILESKFVYQEINETDFENY